MRLTLISQQVFLSSLQGLRLSDPTEKENIFEEEIRQLTGKTKIAIGIEELLIERAKHYGRLEGKAEGKAET